MNIKTKLSKMRLAFAKMLFNEYISGDLTIMVDGEIAEGKEVYVLDSEGVQEPLADGEYTLSDGITITVSEGIVVSMVEPTVDEEMAEVPTVDEDGVEVVSTEEPSDIAEVVNNNAEELAVLQGQVAELVEVITEVVAENEELRKQFTKFSKQPAGKPAKIEIKESTKVESKGAAKYFSKLK